MQGRDLTRHGHRRRSLVDEGEHHRFERNVGRGSIEDGLKGMK